MKRYTQFLMVIFTIMLLQSCQKDEGAITPTGLSEAYTLPQGNEAFDQTIMGYYQTYGTYMLYKFTDKDVYWSPTAYSKPVASAAGFWSPGADVLPANPAYIPAQLDLIKKKWFSFYSDKFLKKFLPSKIMLCSKVDSVSTSFVFTPALVYVKGTKKIAAYYNYDNIEVNYGDASVAALTKQDSLGFVAKINLVFIQSIIARGLTSPTSEFINSADYLTAMTTTTQAYGKGIIISPFTLTVQADWNAYITAMVSYSEANLNKSTAIADGTAQGILNPTKDTTGQIRKRYTMVRNYFINEYQVDLQKIGNASKGV